MANKPIVMSKIRNVIRLHIQGKGKKFIAHYLNLSKNTVKKYVQRFEGQQLCYDQLNALSDQELCSLFQVPLLKEPSARLKALYEYFPFMQKELKRPGVMRLLLWEAYMEKHPSVYDQIRR